MKAELLREFPYDTPYPLLPAACTIHDGPQFLNVDMTKQNHNIYHEGWAIMQYAFLKVKLLQSNTENLNTQDADSRVLGTTEYGSAL